MPRPCFQGLLAVLNIPWLVPAPLQSLLCRPVAFFPVCLRVYVAFLEEYWSLVLGPILIQDGFISARLHLQRPCFQLRSHSDIPVDMNFGGPFLAHHT